MKKKLSLTYCYFSRKIFTQVKSTFLKLSPLLKSCMTHFLTIIWILFTYIWRDGLQQFLFNDGKMMGGHQMQRIITWTFCLCELKRFICSTSFKHQLFFLKIKKCSNSHIQLTYIMINSCPCACFLLRDTTKIFWLFKLQNCF